MRKLLILIALMGISAYFGGCKVHPKSPENNLIAEINNYKMTTDDVYDNFGHMLLYDKSQLNIDQTKRAIIDAMIRKEVLLQEAQRQNLDKDKEFMKTIERYWEQALIKNLINKKTKEIIDSVAVSENELNEYYNQLKEKDPETPELAEIREELLLALKKMKEDRLMEEWISNLQSNSKIIVYEDALKNIDLSK